MNALHRHSNACVLQKCENSYPSKHKTSLITNTQIQTHAHTTGIHDLLFQCINGSQPDIIRTLFSNIILCGGNTRLPGLQHRIQAEISKMAAPKVEVKVMRPSRFAAWTGGSILTSLASFRTGDGITKEEFGECGPGVVHRKRRYIYGDPIV